MAQPWQLDDAQREDVIARLAASMATMGWARNTKIGGEEARSACAVIERKAYTVAQVGSSTTTGARPASETTKAYARKLSELLIESLKSGGPGGAAAQKAQGAAGANLVLDLSASGREFLTGEAAEAELQQMLAPGSAIQTIRFSTKSFGRDAAAVAARAIANVVASLTDADISDIIAGRPEEEALDALRTVCGALASAPLRRLNLSDNALGEKGVRACAQAYANQAGLQSIALQNVGCSIHACRALDELLLEAGHLTQLHLFNNMTDDEGARAIAQLLTRAPRMEDFKLASSRVGPAGGMSLCLGLQAGTSLVRLDLSDNPMTVDVAPALASCLSRQPGLRFLNLNDTSLTDQGVAAVCSALTGSSSLEELELSLNEITPKGAKAVALALVGKSKLTKLNVRENELEDAGAVLLARALASLPNVCTVDAVGNQLGRVGAVALAKAVARNPRLQLLALDENAISETGVEQVQQLLSAAGKSAALGPLDENEADSDDGGDEDEEEEVAIAGVGSGATDDLASALAKTTIA